MILLFLLQQFKEGLLQVHIPVFLELVEFLESLQETLSRGRVLILLLDFLSVDERLVFENLTDSESLRGVAENETFVPGQQHGILS